MAKILDLTGEKFGKLTVLSRAPDKIFPGGQKKRVWKCICECQLELPLEEQKYSYVYEHYLTSGHTKSCVCLIHKLSNYDLTHDYGIGYTSKGEEFYFDLEDYVLIKKYGWCVNNEGYLYAYSKDGMQKMHRLVLKEKLEEYVGSTEEYVVDHINHNKNDNRKINLRIVTKSRNDQNREILKSNKSGVTGVMQRNDSGHWRAYLRANGKMVLNKTFKTFEEAVTARKEAEEKYFGEYSYSNSIKQNKLLKGE